MKIYFASGNQHKKQEMAALFPRYDLVIPEDEGIAFSPEEDGSTFLENSLVKARALWNIVRQPVIADDSGLCVDILQGAPGIYSSRYAGRDFRRGRNDGTRPTQEEQNRLLLEEADLAIQARLAAGLSLPENPRSCRYVCAMVLYLGPERFHAAQETMEGSLVPGLDRSRGAGGFGYDPIVILEGTDRTVAELPPHEKNGLSHRGKAARAIRELLPLAFG